MVPMRVLLLSLLLAAPALAEPPGERLDGARFDELTRGRTLSYGQPDAPPRGIETYDPGKRVTWLWVETGECLEGRWYQGGTADEPLICFVYKDDPAEHCFAYFVDGTEVWSTLPDGTDAEVSYLDRDMDGIACAYLGV